MKTKSLVLLLLLVDFSTAIAETQLPGNFKNSQAVKDVLTGNRKVANAAWWGFDPKDSTYALQGAINSGAGKIIVPYMGNNWIVRPIQLQSNQEIYFEPGVVIVAKKGEFKKNTDSLFRARNKFNITIRGYGAMLKMQKKDYMDPNYEPGQWRTVLTLGTCTNIRVFGLNLIDSGGDGLYIGESALRKPCKDIYVEDCVFDNNYRQGISVTSVDNLQVNNCIFRNTSGSKPGAGIDLEPNNSRNKLKNIIISNCTSENNEGAGFVVSVRNLDFRSEEISILFYNCCVAHCKWGLLVGTDSLQGPDGLVEFRNCIINNTRESGMWVTATSRTFGINFINCKTKNSPITLQLSRQKKDDKIEAIRLDNCYVYSESNRPVAYLKSYKGSKGNANITGTIYAYTPSAQLIEGFEELKSSLIVKRISK